MKSLIYVAGHDYQDHCQRDRNIPGTTKGLTRYEELSRRRIESVLRNPELAGYDFDAEETVRAYVIRFTATQKSKEKNGRQLVVQDFTVSKSVTVPPLFDDSWTPHSGASNLRGFTHENYVAPKKKSFSRCFDKKAVKDEDPKKDLVSILHLYWLIHELENGGDESPIYEVSIFSHSVGGGPVLSNSFIPTRHDRSLGRYPFDYDGRASDLYNEWRLIESAKEFFDENPLGLVGKLSSVNELRQLVLGLDEIKPVYGGTKNDFQEAVEAFPVNVNATGEAFAEQGRFFIWGCSAAETERDMILGFMRGKRIKAREFNVPGWNKFSDKQKEYRSLFLFTTDSDSVWRSLKARGIAGPLEQFEELVDERGEYQRWLGTFGETLSSYPLLVGIIDGLIYYHYVSGFSKGRRGDDALEYAARALYKTLKVGKGRLRLMMSPRMLVDGLFHNGHYGLLSAMAFKVTACFAPPGTEALYQEERASPPLKGYTKSYPIHEIPLGTKTRSGYSRYRYNSFSPRTGKTAPYSPQALGPIAEFFQRYRGLKVNDDGYLVLSEADAVGLLLRKYDP